ncbi:hypothetical protein [Symbioplanes lichenis]|uniref:hypothetical protein n=1 Tax=Symbioplanes lichenis TaxID=1629072 RepID=UPI00273871A5|nr:hypothetical protein [Actinoplanes lichenis]
MADNKRIIGWTAALVAGSGAAYAALLGWDTERDLDPVTSHSSGPYEAWQVVALALIIGALGFAAGRAGHARLATATLTVTVTAAFVLVAVGEAEGDGLWPVGAALVLLGTLAGTLVTTQLGRATAPQPVPVS